MPMGDGRCSLCGYWHMPGTGHTGPLRGYGHCARCGNEHSAGPCPEPEPMRFPSRAEREAIHEMQQSEERARAIIRKVTIERAVRDLTWPSLRAQIATEDPVNPSFLCIGLAQLVRARFRYLAHEGAARPAVGR